MTNSSETQPPTQQAAPSTGAVLAYILLLLILSLSAYAMWLVLAACGIQFAGRTIVFSWCNDPPPIVRHIDVLEDRNRLLQNQVHDAELTLITPDACGPAVASPPVPDLQDEARLCEPDQMLQQPQEVALVLDGSGSMKYSVNVPVEMELRAFNLWEQISSAGGPQDFAGMLRRATLERELVALNQQLENYPGVNRMDMARDSLQRVVGEAPSGTAMSLTSFTDCNRISSRRFGQENRSGLQRAIAGVNAGAGTPVARAMQTAADTLEGGMTADDPVNMVLVTDGNDSCGGDPCAVARALKAARPGLIINVVDMSQSNVLQCVADATGGFYQSNRGEQTTQLIQSLQEAAGYRGAGQCRPASLVPVNE